MTRVYLAGPDVFHPEVEAIVDEKKRICAENGLTGVFPLDEGLDLSGLDPHAQGMAIYRANIGLMQGCDAAIANMTPFRGPSCDPGTAFEIGYMRALGRPVFCYSNVATPFDARSAGYDAWDIEEFDMADNLMLAGAAEDSGLPVATRDGSDLFLDLEAFRACAVALAGKLSGADR